MAINNKNPGEGANTTSQQPQQRPVIIPVVPTTGFAPSASIIDVTLAATSRTPHGGVQRPRGVSLLAPASSLFGSDTAPRVNTSTHTAAVPVPRQGAPGPVDAYATLTSRRARHRGATEAIDITQVETGLVSPSYSHESPATKSSGIVPPATIEPSDPNSAPPDESPTVSPANQAETTNLRRALELAHNRMRALLAESHVPTAITDKNGTIAYANPAWRHLTTPATETYEATSVTDLTHPDDVALDTAQRERMLAGDITHYSIDKRLLRPQGDAVWVRLDYRPLPPTMPNGPIQVLVQAHDITETRLATAMLAHQAMHDPLTGLANRAGCVHAIQRALDVTRLRQHQVAVLTLNLNRFALVNDSLGPSLGDALLVAVGQRLADICGPAHTAARLAGDEFVIVAAPCNPSTAAELADQLLDVVAQPLALADQTITPSASIGITVSASHDTDALRLLRDSGIALHQAKRDEPGSWHVADETLHQGVVERFDTAAQLKHGIAAGELRLHLQPIVDLTNGTVVGREALVRWQHPARGLLAPAAFLPVAEETGLISDIGRWVLAQAARVAAHGPHLGYVAVNVSPTDLRNQGLSAEIERLLDHHELPAASLVIELTESAELANASQARKQLHDLHELGVRMVVDDFGTGFSQLSHLRDLPVSGIKIDRGFTQGLGTDDHCDRIVEALTSLAHGLEVDLIAEGVETPSQAARLTGIGCTHAQGFLFGRPQPAPTR